MKYTKLVARFFILAFVLVLGFGCEAPEEIVPEEPQAEETGTFDANFTYQSPVL